MRPKRMLLTLVLPLGLLLTAGHGLVWATGDADNTGRNVRDRSDAAVTPENQKENDTDRGITAAIRRAIVADNSLSTNAHNVKIITRDKHVTLRGVVDNEGEKAKVADYAHKSAGVERVDNRLEINKR